MRLTLCFLLVLLAVCCYEANAKICKAVMRESTTFVMGSEDDLKKELQRYGAPQEAVDAKLEVKKCVDSKMNMLQKTGISFIVGEIALKCLMKM